MRSKTIAADKKYLLLPIADIREYYAKKGYIQYLGIYKAGKLMEEYEVVLSENPGCWACLYLDRYAGQIIEIRLEGGDEELIDLLELSDDRKDRENLYLETERPLVHLTPMNGYMNDPNGLFYYNGTYHFFAQLNPYGFCHGNTHWMHAVSQDLFHWKELPFALLPDESGLMFSGCGVVDIFNTSGMQLSKEHPPIFLFYTAAGSKSRPSCGKYFEIAVAISLDGGLTFKKYDKNPVINHISFMNRDPKVIWNPAENEWIMMLYLDNHRYQLFYSENLLHWDPGQIIEAIDSAECPDLFFTALDGNESNMKLVLWFCPDNYMVGYMEGRKFVPETELIKGPSYQKYSAFNMLHRTNGGYAAQTFYGLPHGRIVQMSWLQVNARKTKFVNCMSVPNELKLITTEDGPRLTIFPVREIECLYRESYSFAGKGLEELERIPVNCLGESMDMTFKFTVKPNKLIGISVRGILIVYDPVSGRLILPTGAFAVKLQNNILNLRVITDRSCLEIYVSDGRFYTSVNMLLDPENVSVIPVYVDPGTGIDFEIHKMGSMWENSL